MRQYFFAVVIASLLPSAVTAQSPCRQALALGLDVSGSVDAREYRLQLDGLAAALLHPEVRDALLNLPERPVEMFVYEWSGPRFQKIVLPWTAIVSETRLQETALILRRTGRRDLELAEQEDDKYSGADVWSIRRGGDPSTAIGSAMSFGAAQLLGRSCWSLTLDLSGDGQSNAGPRPRDVKRRVLGNGITVNALVIGSAPVQDDTGLLGEIKALSSYFHAEVIHGPDAFVETALGFEDFETAMVRKLLRELSGLSLSWRLP